MDHELREFRPDDRESLVALWRLCELTRPWNDPYRDIERKLSHDPENLLVLESGGELVGSIMIGYEGHRGWVNYLAVHPSHRRRGWARLLMGEAERRLRTVGCAKINVQVRRSNSRAVEFYEQVGFTPEDVLSLGKRLEEDAESDKASS